MAFPLSMLNIAYMGHCFKYLLHLPPQAFICYNKVIDMYLFDNYNISMKEIKFTWDENKNQKNQKKHKVSFEEAVSVFYDEMALLRDDPDHSEKEDRFVILGMSNRAKLLVVCHCYRDSDTIIRIISARKATETESRQYYEF